MNTLRIFLLLVLIATTFLCHAQKLKLPRIFGDKMVLQRGMPVRFWGKASAGAAVSVTIDDFSVNTRADNNGKWEVLYPSHSAGGPYQVQINSNEQLTFRDVYFGDVWIAGGQSNMEWKLSWGVNDWEMEVQDSNYPLIRFFEVPNELNIEPQDDISQGSWTKAGPDKTGEFSAVAWFFAKHNHLEKNVPVGIIDSNWGGTPAEAWMTAGKLKGVSGYENPAAEMLDSSINWDQRIEENKKREERKWQLINDQSFEKYRVHLPDYDDTSWKEISLPNDKALPHIVWVRKSFTIDKKIKNPLLYMGDIVQVSTLFLNGQLIGKETWQDTTSIISLPPKVLKKGENVLAVRAINSWDNNVRIGRRNNMWFENNGKRINLEGTWKYSNTIEPEIPKVEFYFWKPGVLFNGMIKPVAGYSIAGAIWYQGESNADKPQYYEALFEEMIDDWRLHWRQGNFPFLYVQLANFMERKAQPSESNWAELREAQTKTLSLPETGMAVIIDLGDSQDIHPRNKKDVGYRLWQAARKVAFHEDISYSGPMYSSHEVKDDKIYISFAHADSGLTKKGDSLKGFAIAGEDKVFVWATASIEKDKVVVQSEKIKAPKYVRYAWGDNPEAGLYNSEWLPAVPFRTDN